MTETAPMNLEHQDTGGRESLEGIIPETWYCVDCGCNTAPGLLNRADMEAAIEAAKAKGEWGGEGQAIEQTVTSDSELYTVREKVWQAAGLEENGGCLCVGCLEKRLGRQLRPKDFQRGHPFNNPKLPATERLRKRRKDR
jgi:hypothetical protein